MALIKLCLVPFLICSSVALHLRQPVSSEPKVISYNLDVERNTKHSALEKRGTDDLSINPARGGALYFANITVGTPPQPIRAQVDTGSSQLILYDAAIGEDDFTGGFYDANSSSSYHYIASNMTAEYASDTAVGDYARDTVTIGHATLPDLVFGIGYDEVNGSAGSPTWGISFSEEDMGSLGESFTPYYMTKLGLISAPAYSLWLNDIDAPTGSLLFGGVDKSQYTGVLSSLPIVPDGPHGEYFHAKIPFNGIYINNGIGSIANATNTTAGSFPINVTLDSGAGQIYLPLRAAQNIYETFNVSYNANSGLASCDCSLTHSNASIGFAFGDTTIFVPMRSLVTPDSSYVTGTCDFLIWTPVFANVGPSVEGFYLLGDPFLRSAYVVYDLENKEISLAQSAVNSTAPSQIFEITSGTDGVPNSRNISQTALPSITPSGTISPTFVPKPNGAAASEFRGWIMMVGAMLSTTVMVSQL
ncbi:MAG: hypothetical protein M1822_006691 [Bathelium mastoideum]|nr:MAG: hypothetical protein M1822_006691 [Bathelium mastoideum]